MNSKFSAVKNECILSEFLENSDKVVILVFDDHGNLTHTNKTATEILEINSDKDLADYNMQNIFDFRISEVKNELKKTNEISRKINILGNNKQFIQTDTIFSKKNNKIVALSFIVSEQSFNENIIDTLFDALNKVSALLNANHDIDDMMEVILEYLNNLFNYDKALITFLDGDGLIIKSTKNLLDAYNNDYKNTLSKENKLINNLIKSKKSISASVNKSEESIIKELQLNIQPPYSYIVTPLIIKDTLFGFIILIKEKSGFFTVHDIRIAEAISNTAAYSLKDAELSNVFKMQLEILGENITEKAKALEIIKEQNLKILEADKMKNEFLANMSHELRTPMNAIIGFSEALKLKIFGDLNEKQTEYVEDIHASGIHLLGMINDILDLSKLEAKKLELNMKNFLVNDALTEVINVISALSNKKQIEIIISEHKKKIEIYADYRRFQQILYNLLSNAIKFSPENSQIFINISTDESNLIISVKDSGIGIDSKFHQQIFQKFHQVDNSYSRKQGSTGLGLTITKELVEMHKGTIKVESEINKGADFIFTLPLKS